MENVDEYKKSSVNIVISKGNLYQVLPFEVERMGKKLNGKPREKFEMKDNYYKYFFDAEGRIRIIVNPSEFLQKEYDFKLYEYQKEQIYSYICNCNDVLSVSLSIFNNGKMIMKYVYSPYAFSWEKYQYKKNLLEEIQIYRKKQLSEDIVLETQKFFYSESGNLFLIKKVGSNGYTENIFSNIRLNWRVLEEKLTNNLNQILQSIHIDSVTKIGITLFINDLNPEIMLSYDMNDDMNELTGDWTVPEYKTFTVIDVPLNDLQQEKIRKIVAQILNNYITSVLKKSVKFLLYEGDSNLLDVSETCKMILKNNNDSFL